MGTVLIYAAFEDMARFRIRNATVTVLIALFLIDAIANGALWPTIRHVTFGLAMFAILLITYARGALGGGDVKLLSAAFLWMGWENTPLFCILLAVATTAYYVLNRFAHILPGKPGPHGKTLIPYGPCIASAWIVTMLLRVAK